MLYYANKMLIIKKRGKVENQNGDCLELWRKIFFSTPVRTYFSALTIVSVGLSVLLGLLAFVARGINLFWYGRLFGLMGALGEVLGQVWGVSIMAGIGLLIWRALVPKK